MKHFYCIQFPLCKMKIIFFSQSDKCRREKKQTEGVCARVLIVKTVPPIICAIREYSRTFYIQKGEKRSKVQSPHDTSKNKARAASRTTVCHRIRMEGYYIIKMNYPNACLYHNFKPLISPFSCYGNYMKNKKHCNVGFRVSQTPKGWSKNGLQCL